MSVFNVDRVSFWEDEKVLERMGVTVAQQSKRAQCHRTVCLKMVKMVNLCFAYFTTLKKKLN